MFMWTKILHNGGEISNSKTDTHMVRPVLAY